MDSSYNHTRSRRMRYDLHHLWYFWNVARFGGITPASKQLHVTQSTICGIVKQLERDLGSPLFQRQGRSLVLTKSGTLAKSYADEMFALGLELNSRFGGASTAGRQVLRVGVEDMLPDLLVHRLLAPVLSAQVRLECQDDQAVELVNDLCQQHYDVILVDHPITPDHSIRISNHQLGETTLSFMATPKVTRRLTGRFPDNLKGQPMILPSAGSLLSRQLAQWFTDNEVSPDIVADIGDSDLMAVLAAADGGICPVPTVIERDVAKRHGLEVVGRATEIHIRIYAVTTERRLRHAAVKSLLEAARNTLE